MLEHLAGATQEPPFEWTRRFPWLYYAEGAFSNPGPKVLLGETEGISGTQSS